MASEPLNAQDNLLYKRIEKVRRRSLCRRNGTIEVFRSGLRHDIVVYLRVLVVAGEDILGKLNCGKGTSE